LEKVASQLDPVPSEVQYHLGMTYARLGRVEEARTLLTAAVGAGRPFPGIETARETLGSL
jgi:hypothetical protein